MRRLALRFALPVLAVLATLLALSPRASASTTETQAATPVRLADAAHGRQHQAWRRLIDRAEARTRIPVQVTLPIEWPRARLSPAADATQRRAVARATGRVLARLRGTGSRVTQRFETFPVIGLETTPEGLDALRASGLVETVAEDVLLTPQLADSVPMVGADKAWAQGADGRGQAIAVIDTGVDRTHQMLAGKVRAEACFSSTNDCPGGVAESNGPGAGRPCPATVTGCYHGTHVAAIAAGTRGVARSAEVISIAVYTIVTDPAECAGAPPCSRMRTTDVLAGLQWLVRTSLVGRLAAVNVSAGWGHFGSGCDDINPEMKRAIDVLKSVHIATVAAAGNATSGSTKSSLAYPACLSNVVSVGNVDNQDHVDAGSRSSADLSMLAPGTEIRSAVPPGTPGAETGPDGGPVRAVSGTSMAAPHVAGAFAVARQQRLAQAEPADVDSIFQALREGGKPVTDRANGITTPRLQLYDALFSRSIAGPQYELVDLGTDGRVSRANSINNDGVVVGAAQFTANAKSRPFLWRRGDMVQLKAKDPAALYQENGTGSALAISDGGSVAGMTRRNKAGVAPIEYRDTSTAWLDAASTGVPVDVAAGPDGVLVECDINLDECSAHGIDDAGRVVGRAGRKGAFVFGPGDAAGKLLPGFSLGGRSDSAVAVNADGTVAGTALTESGRRAAVTWRRNAEGAYVASVLDINSDIGPESVGADINDAGVMVGAVRDDANAKLQAFRADGPQAIGMLPGLATDTSGSLLRCCSEAKAINRRGEIVGWAGATATARRAVLWSRGGIVDLEKAVENAPEWKLVEATDINDHGEIVGYGYKNGERHAFLLRPAEPVIFLPGIAGSTLANADGDDVWLQCLPDPLKLSLFEADSPAPNLVAGDVLRKKDCVVTTIDVYGTLLETLAASGYREYLAAGKPERRTLDGCDLSQRDNRPNLFVFPYDWRKPVPDAARALHEFVRCIEKLYESRPGPLRIKLLAHSMGGLVARRYVLDHPNPSGEAAEGPAISRMVTLGTPWLGAPRSIYVLESGDMLGIGPRLGKSKSTAHAAASFPSVASLLPSRPAYGLVDPPFGELSNDLDDDLNASESYDYDTAVSVLDNRYPMRANFPGPGPYPATVEAGTKGAEFHDRAGQDDWSADPAPEAPNAIQYVHFHGVKAKPDTIGSVRAKAETDCYGTRFVLRVCWRTNWFEVTSWVPGDGTVPSWSATRMLAPDKDLNAPGAQVVQCAGDDVDHRAIVRNPAVLANVLRALASRERTAVTCEPPGDAGANRARAAAPTTDEDASSWRMTLRGGRDVAITGPDGKPPEVIDLGPAVAGASLPAGTEYRVRFTASGEPLALELTRDDGRSRDAVVRYRDLDVPAGRAVQLRLGADGPDELASDADGDGTYETALPASAKVTGPAAADDRGPGLTVCRVPGDGAARYAVSAVDAQSGVDSTWWSTDDSSYRAYSTPVEIDPAAVPSLHVLADDKAGNRSTATIDLATLESRPRLSVMDATAAEGAQMRFKVQLDCPSDQPVRVSFSTADDGADGSSDFDSAFGSVTFAPGETTKWIDVTVVDDDLDEDDESFNVLLGGAVNASIADGKATGTIRDDDAVPTVSIADASVTEPDTGDATVGVKLELNRASGRAVKVDWTTLDQTAIAGSDYVSATGTATFAPGATTAEARVTVKGDAVPEDDERFAVRLGPAVNAEIGDAEGIVTIQDNDDRLTPGACAAPTITFDGGAGNGSWESAANWTGDRRPGPADDVCIPATALERVTVSGNVEIRSLESRERLSLSGGTSPYPPANVVMRITGAGATNHLRADTDLSGYRTLEVAGTLAIDAPATFTWSSTTFLTGNGAVVIGKGAALEVDGGVCGSQTSIDCRELGGRRTVRNEGTLRMRRGYLSIATANEVLNTGTIELGDDTVLGGAQLTNLGTIRKVAGPGVATLVADFRNEHVAQVTAGRLRLQGTGTQSQTGTFTAAAGAVLDLSGTWKLDAATPVSGAGTFVAGGNGGTITLNGVNDVAATRLESGTLNLNADATVHNFEAPGGTLAGSGHLTVPAGGTFVWGNAKMGGSGTTTIAAGAALELRGTMALADTRTIENQGTATMTGPRLLATGGTFVNAGRLVIPQDASFGGGPEFRFVNSGTLRKSGGTGVLELNGNLHNSGVLRVEAGNLIASMRGPDAPLSGSISVAADSTLELRDGAFRFTEPSALTGKGTLLVGNGASVTLPPVMSIPNVRLAGRELNLPLDVDLKRLDVIAGTLRGAGAVSMAQGGSLLVDGGTLANAGGVTVGDGATMTWSRGALAGTGTTRIAPGAALTVTAPVALDEQHALVNDGAMTLRAGAALRATGGSLVNSGDLTLQAGAAIERTWGAGAEVTNSGRLTTTGPGEARVAGQLHLGGAIAVQAGSLQLFTATRQPASADVSIAPGATLDVYTGSLDWSAGRITGGGSLRLTNQPTVTLPPQVALDALDLNGTLVVPGSATVAKLAIRSGSLRGAGDVTIAPGGSATLDDGSVAGSGTLTVSDGASMTWARGAMTGTGTTRIAPGAALTVTGPVAFDEQRRLLNEGRTTLRPNSAVRATGGELTNLGALDLQANAGIERTWGAGATIRNQGRLTKTDAGDATLAGVLQLGGSVDVRAGKLLLHTATPQTASADVSVVPDAALEIYTGSLQWTGGRITGGGTLRLTNQPTVTLPADVALGVLDVSGQLVVPAAITVRQLFARGGAVRGPGDVTIAGGGSLLLDRGALSGEGTVTVAGGASMTWARGSMAGTGTTRIAPGASLTVTGLGAQDEQRHLVNEGTMTIRENGGLRATGGDLTNSGTLVMGSGNAIERTWGPAYVVTNTGTLITEPGAGTATVGTELRNHGRVSVGRGTLTTGTFRNAAGATLELALEAAGPGRLAATGVARLDGTLAVAPAAGYTPPAGSTARLLTFASREGQFAAVNPASFAVAYDASGVTVTAPAAPPAPARADSAAAPADAPPAPARADAAAAPADVSPPAPAPAGSAVPAPASAMAAAPGARAAAPTRAKTVATRKAGKARRAATRPSCRGTRARCGQAAKRPNHRRPAVKRR